VAPSPDRSATAQSACERAGGPGRA